MTDRDHFAAADDIVRRALSRKREWEEHGPARWGYGVAVDMLALERRVGALERISAELEYAMGRERERTNHDAAPECADLGNRPEPPDSSRDDAPGEGWRWVEPHEPLESGDQFLSLVGRGWLPAKCYSDGRPSAYHRFFRRRIDAKTDHDAAPAARAQLPTGDHASGGSGSVGTDNADPLTRWGTGDTQEPVAWGVATSSGVIATSISRIDAVDMQSDYECDTEVIPLYRSPTLTEEEREVLEEHLLTLDETARNLALMSEPQNEALIFYRKNAATLRGLLERTK